MKTTIQFFILLVLYIPQLYAQSISKEETVFFNAIIEAKSNPKDYYLNINNYALAKCLNDETLADNDKKLINALSKLKSNDEQRKEFYGLVNYYYTSDFKLIHDAFIVIKRNKDKNKIIIVNSFETLNNITNLILTHSYTKIKYSILPDSLYIPIEGTKDEVLVSAEVNAQYPGGDKALMEFVRSQIKYPTREKKENITGKILIRFIIEKNGSVSNVEIMKKISPGLDHEGMRVIKMMPLWKPAYNGGRPVRQYYNMPINFTLQ